MNRISMLRRSPMLTRLLGLALMAATMPVMVQAAPVGQQGSAGAGAHDGKQVQAQLKDVDAKISTARAHNTELQAQVSQMEHQNSDRHNQLQQRDDEIAALQKKLQTAGAPTSVSSSGH